MDPFCVTSFGERRSEDMFVSDNDTPPKVGLAHRNGRGRVTRCVMGV